MQMKNSLSFKGVREWDNKFLSLFPHRFDYIWAEHPNPGAKVEWKTETRHSLSDRVIHQGSYLYGVSSTLMQAAPITQSTIPSPFLASLPP